MKVNIQHPIIPINGDCCQAYAQVINSILQGEDINMLKKLMDIHAKHNPSLDEYFSYEYADDTMTLYQRKFSNPASIFEYPLLSEISLKK